MYNFNPGFSRAYGFMPPAQSIYGGLHGGYYNRPYGSQLTHYAPMSTFNPYQMTTGYTNPYQTTGLYMNRFNPV